MTTVTFSFEGGTNGNTVAAGSGAGTGDTNFDTVSHGASTTDIYDTAQAAHGTLGNKVATGATSTTSYHAWSTAIGTQTTVWVRAYLFFTAAPSVQHRVINFVGSAASRGNVLATTTGKLIFTNAAGGTVLTSNAFPTGAWFRLEAMFTGSATVGQWEYKIWNSPDSSGTPDDTQTSAANLNTGGTCDSYRFGIGAAVASAGPYWFDDVGVSTTAYIGPAVTSTNANAGLATGTGAARAPDADTQALAGLAAATGTAPQPSVTTSSSGTANAGLATGTGAAQQPAAAATVSAGQAAATGTAPAPDAGTGGAAGQAAGTGTAQQPSTAVTVSAGLATGTGTARQPQVSFTTTANAGLATAAGDALFTSGTQASADAIADTPVQAIGQAFDATISVVPVVGAPAGVASGMGATAAASVTVQPGARSAQAAAAAPAAAVAIQANTGAAQGTASAGNAISGAGAHAGSAQAAAATASPALAVQVPAGAAQAAGTAQPATGGWTPGFALASAAALSAAAAVRALAGLAQATAASNGATAALAQVSTGTAVQGQMPLALARQGLPTATPHAKQGLMALAHAEGGSP